MRTWLACGDEQGVLHAVSEVVQGDARERLHVDTGGARHPPVLVLAALAAAARRRGLIRVRENPIPHTDALNGFQSFIGMYPRADGESNVRAQHQGWQRRGEHGGSRDLL